MANFLNTPYTPTPFTDKLQVIVYALCCAIPVILTYLQLLHIIITPWVIGGSMIGSAFLLRYWIVKRQSQRNVK